MEYNKVNWRMKSDGLTREEGSSSNGLLTNTVYQDSVTVGPYADMLGGSNGYLDIS
jgi:hypothetical protein